MSRYEVTPYDPQGRAHASRILPSKEEAERLAKAMRKERRGTGWTYEVGPFPQPAERRASVLQGAVVSEQCDNPLLLGVSVWWWAAGAAAVAAAGYLALRKGPRGSTSGAAAAAAKVKQVQSIPLAGFATPADYIQKTAFAVGGYGSAYEKRPWKDRRTSQVPPAARAVWAKQEIAFRRRAYERNFWAKGQVPPAMPDGYFAEPKTGFSPPLEGVSKQKFLVFRPGNNETSMPNGSSCPGAFTSAECEAVWGWNPTDEFGNAYEGWGVSSDPLNTVFLIVATVLPYIPGIGSAASATIAGLVALGQGKSLDKVALAAARAALPAGAQLAFDLGVGVVLEKKPVDQALTDAALNQLDKEYPGSKAAYAQGKDLANQYGLGAVQWL